MRSLNIHFWYTVSTTYLGDSMKSIHNLNYDYLRAVRMLEKSINTPMDLVRFWSLSGPCLEDQPEIEKIVKKDWQ